MDTRASRVVPISQPGAEGTDRPATVDALREWIATELRAPGWQKDQLQAALDAVVARERRLGFDAKVEAVATLASGFTERMAELQQELAARDQTVSSMVEYFEDLVAELSEKARRDPKTTLLNFTAFMDQVESLLAVDQRGRWCALGIVDIADFKWVNDHLGHAAGDRIIQRVARLLAEQLRSGDLLAQDAVEAREVHARFGGDEFCFLIPDLNGSHDALAIAERFRSTVETFDWTEEHPRLADHPIMVDVGVVCLRIGPLHERHEVARSLANEMLHRADELMYEAKRTRANRVLAVWTDVVDGRLSGLPEPGASRSLRAASE